MKRSIIILILIVAVSLCLRAALANYRHIIQHDEVGYVLIGRNIAIGNGFSLKDAVNLHAERFLSHYPHSAVMQTPIYPMFTALIYFLFHSLPLASKLNYIIFGGLVAFPVYFLAREIYGKRTAIISAALMAFLPSWILSCHFWNAVTEQSYLLLVVTGALCLYMAVKYNKPGPAMIASLLFALGYLSRPDGASYFLIGFLFIALRARRCLWRYMIPFGVVFICYALFIYSHVGELYFTAPKIHWVKEASAAEGTYFTNVIQAVKALGTFGFFPYYLFAFLFLGLFKDKWTKQRAWGELFLFLLFISQYVTVTPFVVRTRYFFASLPFLLIWIGHGIEETEKWFTNQRLPRFIPLTCVILSFFAITGLQLKFELKNPIEHKKLAFWIKENTPEDATIMTREFHTLFYSGRDGVWVPDDADIKGKADYVIIDEIVWNSVEPLNPELKKYLDAKDYGFMYPVYEGSEDERKVILYKFRK